MTIFQRLRLRDEPIRVAVTGAGLIGRGMVYQIDLTPSMQTALIVNRTPGRAVDAYLAAGREQHEIFVSDDLSELQRAVNNGRAAVTSRVDALRELSGVDAVCEVTGAVQYGAEVALAAIDGGKHVVMMNAETDALVGCALQRRAAKAGVVYTNSDGDQPGVLMRLCEYVRGTGFEIVAAVNCKGFMDVHATPETIRPWAEKQNTSLPMTTAFTDGTKMNIENAVLANATGLVPAVRGMHGVKTEMKNAIQDCMAKFTQDGIVDYTLGGNFAGGVFVIGRGDGSAMVQPYMQYLKMGPGPEYIFYRPYHLCHVETPITIAEAVMDQAATIAPMSQPVVEVVAMAKRPLETGEALDGIGGFAAYGEIDTIERATGCLPIGLAEDLTLSRDVPQDEPIPLDAVDLDEDALITRLWREQHTD